MIAIVSKSAIRYNHVMEQELKKETAPEKSDAEKRYFNSPFTGALHPITEAPDEAFAGKMTGDGFFVYPEDGVVYAPEDSTVTFVFDTKHALGMTTADGVEYLLEMGMRGNVAFIKAAVADKSGNCFMKGTAKNFGALMARAADYVVCEATKIVEVGEIDPEMVTVPSIFVDAVVPSEV